MAALQRAQRAGTSFLRDLPHLDMHSFAEQAGVCGRPVVRRCTDRVTGDSTLVPIRCGSTREAVCRACAQRAQALRAHQCAEGWHLDEDPVRAPREPEAEQSEPEPPQDGEERAPRLVRSTRRRSDAADLPRVPMDERTVGRAFAGRDGRIYRPSMFVTLTLPSYGKVVDGVPVDPKGYDYARAARDAVAFSALFDRWMQNLRRCAGYSVQYFAAVEGQRRGAAHIHLAIRGAIPRALLKQVTKATYMQQWWPAYGPEDVRYPGEQGGHGLPVWDGNDYVDPYTRQPLPTWRQMQARIKAAGDTAVPSHVARFGSQVDVKGIIAPSADADRGVKYLTKYLTKNVADTYATTDLVTGKPAMAPAMAAHLDRLHEATRLIPCGTECPNWLRHGVQPCNAGPGAVPGMCPGPAHDRENLGLGGRRVLTSRQWSGKTLAQHAADRAAVVRETLAEAGITAPDADRLAADTTAPDGSPRYVWEALDPEELDHRTYALAVLALANERHRWREQYRQAKRHRDGPRGACGQPLSNSDDQTREAA